MEPVNTPQQSAPATPNLINPAPYNLASKKKGKLEMLMRLLIILFLLCISGAAGYTIFKNLNSNKETEQTSCTMEAKICPDGSSVGRTGPNCEFSACPTATPDATANWQTYTNEEYGFEIKYPNIWNIYYSYGGESFSECVDALNPNQNNNYDYLNLTIIPQKLNPDCSPTSGSDSQKIYIEVFKNESQNLEATLDPYTFVNLNGINFLKQSMTSNNDTIRLGVNHNGKYFGIFYENNDPIFDQIISTLKLTN